MGARVDKLRDAFAGSQAALFVLRVNRFRAATLADLFLLVLDLGQKLDDAAGILFEVWRIAIGGRFQDRNGHAGPSQKSNGTFLSIRASRELCELGRLIVSVFSLNEIDDGLG